MDGPNHAPLQDQILESGAHPREHVDTEAESPEEIACQVEPLQGFAGGEVDHHGDGHHGVTAQAETGQHLTGHVEQSCAEGRASPFES